MNTVLFNFLGVQLVCQSPYHGSREYAKTVYKNLVEEYFDKTIIYFAYNPELMIEDWIMKLNKEKNIVNVEVYSLDEIASYINNVKIDVMYSAIRVPAIFKNKLIDNVTVKVTLHDLREIELLYDKYAFKYMDKIQYIKNVIKKRFDKTVLKALKKKVKSELDAVDDFVCITNHTKYSLINIFPEYCDREIPVFYTPYKTVEVKDRGREISENYILIIGGDRWVKNPYRTLDALDKLFDNNKYKIYKAVVVGNVTSKYKRRVRNTGNFIFEGYVDEDVLENYYAYCDVFIYASLNEGFGMPPLEAMKYGKTCIISGTTSLPEIYGGAAYYVNPYNTEEIKEKVMWALDCRIDETIISERYRYITDKQSKDLISICDYIVGER